MLKNYEILKNLSKYEEESFWLWGKSVFTSTLRFLLISLPFCAIFIKYNLKPNELFLDEVLTTSYWIIVSYLVSIPFNYYLDVLWIWLKKKFKELL